MRILIANDQHWPMKSGVATVARLLALNLAKRGHEVLVIAPSQTGKKYSDEDENYRIVRMGSIGFPKRDNFRVSAPGRAEIRGIIRGFGPDIVHIHTQGLVGLTTMNVAHKLGIPVIATNHLMGVNITGTVKALQPFGRSIDWLVFDHSLKLYHNADYIIMPTQMAIDMFDLSKIKVPVKPQSNGIDLSRFKPGPVPDNIYKKFDLPKEKKIVGYLGRVDAEKHLHVILEAAPKILAANPDTHFLFVGTGNDLKDLHDLAKKLKIEKHVTFTGRVDDDDIDYLFRAIDVYIMPSPAELQSMSTMEAMASGKPIVAANKGATPELCQEGKNGFLFELDDEQVLADRVIKLLNDNELRKRFGEASVKIAASHNINTVIKQFEKLYKEVIARKKKTISGQSS